MKKNIGILSIIVLLIGTLNGCTFENKKGSSLDLIRLKYEDIADKLIRFHVIANSDSDEDQALKLKVRDRVIEELSVKLNEAKTLDEARNILVENIDFVNDVAKEVVIENNYNYDIKTTLSNENFPDKIYGDYVFPQGNYEAFRVIIGSGSGHNWWCVMFPPLCFVDETKSEVDSEKLESSVDSLMSDEKTTEVEELDRKKTENKEEQNNEVKNEDGEPSDNKVIFKSKMVELFSDLF